MTRSEIDALSKHVIGAAIEVHRNLGPGLLKSAYAGCLCVNWNYRVSRSNVRF